MILYASYPKRPIARSAKLSLGVYRSKWDFLDGVLVARTLTKWFSASIPRMDLD